MHLKHRVLLGTYSVIACARGIFHLVPATTTTTISFLCKGTLLPLAILLQGFFFFFFLTAHGGHTETPVNAHCEIEWPNGHDLVAFHGWKVDGR